MELIKIIKILNPPTKYIYRAKTKIDPKTGKFKETTYYLTANLFYSGVHYGTRMKIVGAVKDFLIPFLIDIPKLQKMRLEVTYCRNKDNFDLDNKMNFWVKMILDLLKTPTSKQVRNFHLKGKEYKTVSVIREDTVKYVDEINMKYERGEHKLIIKIFGIKELEQKKLL